MAHDGVAFPVKTGITGSIFRSHQRIVLEVETLAYLFGTNILIQGHIFFYEETTNLKTRLEKCNVNIILFPELFYIR